MSTASEPSLRRDFDLPEEDEEYLDARRFVWETSHVLEGATRSLWLFIHEYPLPRGYCGTTDAAGMQLKNALLGIRVTGYPGGALDMAYFHPPIRRADGRPIPNLGELTLDGKLFQQWSRHYSPTNPFRVGTDSIGTHLGLVEEWLRGEFSRP